MSKGKPDVWRTGDGREIPYDKMDVDHLESAFINICSREFEKSVLINRLWAQVDTIQKVKKKLKAEATRRGITLKYPDEKFPSAKFGNYFENERKNPEDAPELTDRELEQLQKIVSKKPVLSREPDDLP